MSGASMVAEARKSLGLSGRPNYITKEYASRYGSEFLRASWCDMGVTYWARHSGNAAAVLPGGDRAYTVWHAQDFQRAGRWHSGTTANVNQAKPGDIVFFDWGASNSIGAIDHVGVIEKVLGGGRLQTIEANTSDAVRRRVRDASVIAGYGRPAYDEGEDDMPSVEDIWEWDGIPSPRNASTHKQNPTWKPASFLQENAERIRDLQVSVAANGAAIGELAKTVAALAADRGQAVDADALVARIEAAIESVTVRLDVDDAEDPTPKE